MSEGDNVTASTVAAEPEAKASEHRSARDVSVGLLRNYSLLALLILLIVLFSAWKPTTFFNVDNFRTILNQNSVLGIVSLAALFPLVVGQFDLSVGANLGLAMVLSTGLASKANLGAWVAIGLAILCSVLVGVLNGVLVAKFHIDAFVTTLGMSSLLAGGVIWYTNGQVIADNIPQTLISLGESNTFGIPNPIIFLAVVVVVVWYLVQATPFGRFLYAIGGSREASRLSGLNVDRYTIIAFSASGLLCGIAGVIQAGSLGSGDPLGGPPFLLPAFAAVFLGATSFRSGTFNVTGTVVAVFVIAVGINGLIQVGVPSYVYSVFTGAALIVSALAFRFLNRTRTA